MKMKMLNLGCGDTFHPDWVNIDFKNDHASVINHNLLSGIPFDSGKADVVYHSHVLEHFTQADGKKFLAECYRVLKPGGIVRIAVPDLENIVREYLRNMEDARAGKAGAAQRYDWIKLELIDQMARHRGAGQCGAYLSQRPIPEEKYVLSRWGESAKVVSAALSREPSFMDKVRWKLRHPFAKWQSEAKRVGRFRLSGEVHLWMYDSYSLGRALMEAGFSNPVVVDAFHSSIPRWKEFELEEKNGEVRKPDTLVMEAVKG